MKRSISLALLVVGLTMFGTVRSAQDLKYPGDCKDNTLKAAAQKNGCTIEDGGKHWKVSKDGAMSTTIPYRSKKTTLAARSSRP
jgi:hypothetical protein